MAFRESEFARFFRARTWTRILIARGGVGRQLSPLRLGLVGIDWERKGGPLFSMLPRSSSAWDTRSKSSFSGPTRGRPGAPVPQGARLRPQGSRAPTIRRDPQELPLWLPAFSVEASGFSTLEYLRLGIPIVTTAVGGIVDPKDAGLRFPVDADGEQIAEALAGVLREPDRYAAMRKTAARDGVAYSWDRTANEMLSLLDGTSRDT